ncbi:MAG: DNA mismatch repair endonuclease MutL [Candidatus Gastranaerophilales bacterium]|nr:DNA mismatch repair endonuclease MutL [Candidatus Gastranaerophilales bacterium]MCM1073271.1 DNA mismatch repair endonuclease MutL [Bacteroides sp.]
MGRIVQLSKNVINQIAAGEVIERPYSVVKELVENSVDAGATKISIEVSNECRDLRIADNGSGIHPDDILLAFSKHATSKIKSGEDLFDIRTMGFRGEALASIISISKLTCITRTTEFDNGTKVECSNSEVKQTPTGCAVGTIMEIRDLFYNLPARLKFLKSAKTEFAYISEYIQTIALVHPEVSFELKFNGKTSLKTTAQNEQIQTIKELFSQDVVSNLKPVLKTDKLSGLKMSGFVSTPDYTRASKKDYYMYVNSRAVKCPVFQKSIDMVYKNLTGSSRYPFIVLNLELPPADVDVNVHPTKKEVRYKNPNQIFNFIQSSVSDALRSSIETVKEEEEPIFINEYKEEVEQVAYVPEETSISDIFTKKLEEDIRPKNIDRPKLQIVKETVPEVIQQKVVAEPEFKQEDVIIGQYKKTYILIEKEDGLEIVDQHIAEERFIYETLKKSKNIDCQLLFISDVLEVSPSDKALLETNKDKLLKFGYEIDFLSETEVIFRKVPQMISKVSPKEILADILENISGDIDNIEEKILITTSCKAAVKANTYLNQYQMEEIIRNWRKCENPETCPHGRPVSKFFEHKELAKFFQRNK